MKYSKGKVVRSAAAQRVGKLMVEDGYGRRLLAVITLCAVVGNVLLLYAPTLIGQIIEHIASGKERVLPSLFALAIAYLCGSAMVYLCTALCTQLSTRTVAKLRDTVFARISRLPLKTLDRMSHGDLTSRISNDADLLSDGLNQLLLQLVAAVITVAAALFFMLRMNFVMTLAVVATTPLVFVVSRAVSTNTAAQFRSQQELVGELNGYADEQFKGQRVVRAFHAEEAAQQHFEKINEKLYTVGQKAQFYSSLTNPSTRFVNYVGYILVGLVGGFMAIYTDGAVTVGIIASFLTYANLFSKPFNEITAITSQIMAALASAERIYALVDEPIEGKDPAPVKMDKVMGKVDFERVSFGYTEGKPLIKGFNLGVEPGQKVGIVGPTGAGKTTMINLLMRFYDVDSGWILVDDLVTADMPRDQLRRCFGMVLQDAWLFSGTVAENIAYGKPDAKREETEQAARQAGAHGFIRTLPKGYDTVVEESGENLSQGQRQLLTIARAMLINSPMLILDEATSSVDTLTEQKIQHAFLKMMQGHTSFVIAHRLSTVQNADIILVMDKGSVVERGTHDQLLKRDGLYAELYRSQFLSAGEA